MRVGAAGTELPGRQQRHVDEMRDRQLCLHVAAALERLVEKLGQQREAEAQAEAEPEAGEHQDLGLRLARGSGGTASATTRKSADFQVSWAAACFILCSMAS